MHTVNADIRTDSHRCVESFPDIDGGRLFWRHGEPGCTRVSLWQVCEGLYHCVRCVKVEGVLLLQVCHCGRCEGECHCAGCVKVYHCARCVKV